jgi:dTDP-4-dehydrorhamnose reductase
VKPSVSSRKILLLGKNGKLGWELHRTLAPLGEVWATSSKELNLLDTGALRSAVREYRPQWIVNAAAYTEVDKAESELDLAFAINATAPGVLAEEALRIGAAFIHYSTDYVFDGTKGEPYTEEDAPNPINAYGRSKLAGEQVVRAVGGAYLILRTAWVYSLRGHNFVTRVLELAQQQETMRIVDDQISNPTWARMLAETTAQVLAKDADHDFRRPGIYHLAGDGFASRYEWAVNILKCAVSVDDAVKDIAPAKTSDFPTAAARPLFSALNCKEFSTVFGLQLPHWSVSTFLAFEA